MLPFDLAGIACHGVPGAKSVGFCSFACRALPDRLLDWGSL
jgi:hypothetical protein